MEADIYFHKSGNIDDVIHHMYNGEPVNRIQVSEEDDIQDIRKRLQQLLNIEGHIDLYVFKYSVDRNDSKIQSMMDPKGLTPCVHQKSSNSFTLKTTLNNVPGLIEEYTRFFYLKPLDRIRIVVVPK